MFKLLSFFLYYYGIRIGWAVRSGRFDKEKKLTNKSGELINVSAERPLAYGFQPNSEPTEISPSNLPYRVLYRSVKGFKCYRGSKNSCSHRKGKSSLTLQCTTVHACECDISFNDLFVNLFFVSCAQIERLYQFLYLVPRYARIFASRCLSGSHPKKNFLRGLSLPLNFQRTFSVLTDEVL
jgi:hypothetical protein